MIFRLFANWIIAKAKRTPYFHLQHADGSFYMERFWLFRTPWINARVHHIHTPDHDRHLHDHPWTFISIILRGSYIEARPRFYEPRFFSSLNNTELVDYTYRREGSIALRRAIDRHLIDLVSNGGVWTLVFTFPNRHKWGFYTPEGKIPWKKYESTHNIQPVIIERQTHG